MIACFSIINYLGREKISFVARNPTDFYLSDYWIRVTKIYIRINKPFFDKDISVALKRVCPYEPMSSVYHRCGVWTITHHMQSALVKLPYGAKKITFKAN